MSELFGRTLRDAPADIETEGHKLLLRAGFVRRLSSGIFSYLPLAKRSLEKTKSIMREEMEAVGGQEIEMPVVHPADMWKRSGRYDLVGPELARLSDRREREMVLAMTHEEVVAELAAGEVESHRQLPRLVYQIQTKFRDDPRPRAGLVRAREFTMKDAYSLDRDEAGLDRRYRALHEAYFRVFERCGLPTVSVGADVGVMGGSESHEFMYMSGIGEDTIIVCPECGYTANRQIAAFRKPAAEPEEPKPLEKVSTPGADTIESLAKFMDIPASKTAKSMFMVAGERLVVAVLRGDMSLNETKLANALGTAELRPAREDEITTAGAVPGYGSPIGTAGATVVVDDAVPTSPNLVAGANEEGFHLSNANLGRDFEAGIIADIALAERGAACIRCGSPVEAERGVEVGNIFKLGVKYSEALGASFLDEDGGRKPIVMGSYGIGVGRLLACVAEKHRDENGLMWPMSVAPYHVHLVSLGDTVEEAERLCRELESAGVEVLHDDRDERLGVKFKDADLIGVPVRVAITPRSLKNGGVEVKLRRKKESEVVPRENVRRVVEEKIEESKREL
ncbi:MAG: proline--tRNA ligase [Rubrobacteraceae bacterium]|jgi:prolyl-tRNA synthetase|nr:proline--tRNA ligase [Rubrobacter sp.]